MRKVIIAILSVIAIATIVLPEGEYGPITITSYAAEGQFNSNGLQANNLDIPIDKFVDAPATAPVPFGQLVDAPMTAPVSVSSDKFVDAPMTAPPAGTTTTTKETTTTTTAKLVPAPETAPEVLDTAPATAPTTSTSTTTTTTVTTTTIATTATTSASIVLADMKCADGAEVRVSEDSNGKVEIEASGEKDLLKEIFGFIKDLFS